MSLGSIDRTKLTTSIVERLLDGIESGSIEPGSALPAERELAATLGVSRGSLREAIRVLEHSGVVDVRTGSGTYVTEAGASRVALMRAHAEAAGEHSPLDVIVARRAVEPQCAALAAEQRHAHDLDRLRATLATHATAVERGGDPAELDISFHVLVAQATHNPVFVVLVERLAQIMRRAPWSELKHDTRVDPEGAARDVEEHAAVLRAIEAEQPLQAADAMTTHLQSVEADLHAQVGSR